MNSDFDTAKAILRDRGEITGVTSGNSMKPLFRSGKDRAVIIPKPDFLKVNDVLLYRKKSTNEVILHRVIKATDNGLIIRGDNLYFNETNVDEDDIIGVLKGFYRNGRYYDCKKSISYKLYVVCIRLSYPLRRFAFRVINKLKKLLGL